MNWQPMHLQYPEIIDQCPQKTINSLLLRFFCQPVFTGSTGIFLAKEFTCIGCFPDPNHAGRKTAIEMMEYFSHFRSGRICTWAANCFFCSRAIPKEKNRFGH